MASWNSAVPTGKFYPRSPFLLQSRTLSRPCERATRCRGSACTPIPGWFGDRLDVGWAIDVLHPLAQASRCQDPPASEPWDESDDV